MDFWQRLSRLIDFNNKKKNGLDFGFYIYVFVWAAGFAGLTMTFLGVVWQVLGLYGILVSIGFGLIFSLQEYTKDLKKSIARKKKKKPVYPLKEG